MVRLRVNGKNHELDIDPETPLLWVIREHLDLPGTKYSCGIGECGACNVHMDGKTVQSCTITAGEAQGSEITTIEGLGGPVAEKLVNAWVRNDVPQCGYCQPGQLMKAAEILTENPKPGDDEIKSAMSGVLCRCGTYQHIQQAIKQASKEL